MKQIKDLMPLATLEDLRAFCQDYARKDKKFNKEQDWQRLFFLLMDANHHTLDMFDKYAHYLKSTHSDGLIAEYISMVKDYATRNMGAKHYSRIRQAMEAMLKLNNGTSAAHQLAEHFRDVYPRRTSFMAEISKF